MKKMNKKGFTLVELLAVIVVLGVILAIAIPSVTSTIAGAKADSYASSAKMMKEAAVTYASTNENVVLPTDGNCIVITLSELDIENVTTDPFGGTYEVSYVAIVNDGGTYKYYVTLQSGDEGKGILNTLSTEIDGDAVITMSSTLVMPVATDVLSLDTDGDGAVQDPAVTATVTTVYDGS